MDASFERLKVVGHKKYSGGKGIPVPRSYRDNRIIINIFVRLIRFLAFLALEYRELEYSINKKIELL